MSQIGRNLTWLLLSQLATWAMTLVTISVVPRLLGPSAFGSLGIAVAYTGFVGLAIGLGTSQLVTREVARDASVAPGYVFNGVALKLVLTTVLGGAAMLLGRALGFSGQLLTLVLVGWLGLYAFSINEIYAGVLAGMQRMGKTSALGVVAVYSAAVGGIGVLLLGGGVVAFAVVQSLSLLVPMIGMMLLLPHITRGHRVVDWSIMRHLVTAGTPLMLLTALNQVYTTIDMPMLAAMTEHGVAGWYAVAYRWAAIPIFIATVASNSFFPEMSKHGAEGGPVFAGLVNRALQLVLLLAVPTGIGLAAVAGDLISFANGSQYANAVRPMQILALQLPITCVDTILGTAFVARGRLRNYLLLSGAMVVLNPILNVVAIRFTDRRYGNGAIGAAAATAATEVLVLCGALALAAPGVMDRSMRWWTARCLLAGAAVAGAVIVTSSTPLAVQVAAGILAYAAASFGLRTVTPAMVRMAREQLVGAIRRRPVLTDVTPEPGGGH